MVDYQGVSSNNWNQTPSSNNSARQDNRATKKCPYCAEDILKEAKVCKHCKTDLKAPRPIGGSKLIDGLVFLLLVVTLSGAGLFALIFGFPSLWH